jgi:hypothetical protein
MSTPSRWTVKDTVSELFVRSGSVVALLLMDAVLLVVSPPGGTVTSSGAVALIVMLSEALVGNVVRVQVTARVGWSTEHDQFGPLAEILVKPFGRVSVTETVLDASGPALRGCRVKVAGCVPIIGKGDADLVM